MWILRNITAGKDVKKFRKLGKAKKALAKAGKRVKRTTTFGIYEEYYTIKKRPKRR